MSIMAVHPFEMFASITGYKKHIRFVVLPVELTCLDLKKLPMHTSFYIDLLFSLLGVHMETDVLKTDL